MRVLVVDDSAVFRSVLQRRLGQLGHECVVAQDADEGLAVWREVQPDVVISDWIMPGRDGIDLCRDVRAGQECGYTYFIVLTSLGGTERLVEAMEAGADDFLEKPVDEDRLEAALIAADRVTRLHLDLAESEVRARALADEQAVLARIATAIATGVEAEGVFAEVAQSAASLCGTGDAVVWRYDRNDAVVAGSWGATAIKVDTVRPRELDVSLPGSATSPRVVEGDWAMCAGCEDEVGTRSSVVAPVRASGNAWGAVTVTSTQPFHARALGRVTRLAELAGVAVKTAEFRESLVSQAVTDPLTGLANRRGFQESLEAEVVRAARHRRALSLVVIDVDHFKRINDTHGHPTGDEVLKEIARRLADEARTGEVVARIGGEEFAWILPEAPGAGAMAAAERVRLRIASEPFTGVGAVTVSLGASDLERAEWDREVLMRQADAALYEAKERGRDRSVLSGDEGARTVVPPGPVADPVATFGALRVLAQAVDLRTPATWRHSERVSETCVALARELDWPSERSGRLREAALIHDVGFTFVGVDDPSFSHAAVGALAASLALDDEQVSWVRSHHERHDGAGGGEGLAAEAIPDGARILALAEEWDVLTCTSSDRQLSIAEALDIVDRASGSAFDPDVVAALRRVILADRDAGTPEAPASGASA